jgi:hypothetical protein
MLLNIVLAPIDETISALAHADGVTYTRYVDDLTFSGTSPFSKLLERVEDVIRSSGFEINARKRHDWKPGSHPKVTGIVLASSLQPDPEFLGALTAELLQMEHGNWRVSGAQLRGWIAWVQALDPQLGKTLLQRFAETLGRRSRRRRIGKPRCRTGSQSLRKGPS